MLAYAMVGILILAAAGLIASNLASGGDTNVNAAGEVVAPTLAYFYDVGSGELFSGPGDEPGPIAAPSGATLENGSPGGVKALVYTCGACTPEEQFTSYLEILDPIEREKPFELRNPSNSHVAAPTGAGEPEWHPRSSPEGTKITQSAGSRCTDGQLKQCQPAS